MDIKGSRSLLLSNASQLAHNCRSTKPLVLALTIFIALVAHSSEALAQNTLEAMNLAAANASQDEGALYDQAVAALNQSDLIKARKLLSAFIEKHPHSTYLAFAKLGIAESFYQEKLTDSLAKATTIYEEWLKEFPEHPLTDRVMFKAAGTYIQLRQRPRGENYTFWARRKLKEILERFPNSELRPQVEKELQPIEEELAEHYLKVALFYLNERTFSTAARGRLEFITTEYLGFSQMDRVLALLGKICMDEAEADEAKKYYQRLVCQFPQSSYSKEAMMLAEQFGIQLSTDCEVWRKEEKANSN